jgi:hypothetical protein
MAKASSMREQHIFAERFSGVIAPFARCIVCLDDLLALVGYAPGGKAGQQLSTKMEASMSPDAFLRQIHSQASLASAAPRTHL